jgi:hypothetical protein
MDEATLFTLLKTLNLPVAYHHFVAPPTPPYIVYLLDNTDNFGADNKVYKICKNFMVELYTKTKDPTSEALIEGLFDANEIYWEKTETYIDSEGLYQVLYDI